MYIDETTIYFSDGKFFCRKTIVLSVLHRSLGKIEKSFSPKLPDYFIQGVKIKYEILSPLNIWLYILN